MDNSDINERLETLVRGIVSCTPYVGSAISGVIGFFWPADDPDPLGVWNQVKQYIPDLIEEIISTEKTHDLELKLAGIKEALEDFQNTSYGVPQKGQWFTSVLSSIDNAEPFFFDQFNPEKTLTYFVSMGTIKLMALREQYLFYDQIYLVSDPDKDKHLQKLKNTIVQYLNAAHLAKYNAVQWRLSLITQSYREKTSFNIFGPFTESIYAVEDKHVTDKLNPHSDLYQEYEVDYCGGYSDARYKADYLYSNRRAQVQADLEAKLDKFLSPTYLWDYLDPTNPNTSQKKPIDVISGQFGGRSGSAFQDNPNDQPITKVIVHAGSLVDSVEFFYGGISGGLHGGNGGLTYSLKLNKGEHIVSAHGRAGDSVDMLYFKTNHGREVGGGGHGGTEWQAAPPEGTGAILRYISGVQGPNICEGITLHWRYWVGGEEVIEIGWEPQYYETIQFADIDGDGRAELIARSAGGIMAWKYDPKTGKWDGGSRGPELSDKNGWNKPEYYKTIQCADIDDDGRAELIARDSDGILVWKYDPKTGKWDGGSRGPELSDKEDWGLPLYYKTIQCADVDGDGRAELIARDSVGLFTHWWSQTNN